jgi:hypothetical protein
MLDIYSGRYSFPVKTKDSVGDPPEASRRREFCQTLGSGAVFGTMLVKSGVQMRERKASLYASSYFYYMAMRKENRRPEQPKVPRCVNNALLKQYVYFERCETM